MPHYISFLLHVWPKYLVTSEHIVRVRCCYSAFIPAVTCTVYLYCVTVIVQCLHAFKIMNIILNIKAVDKMIEFSMSVMCKFMFHSLHIN